MPCARSPNGRNTSQVAEVTSGGVIEKLFATASIQATVKILFSKIGVSLQSRRVNSGQLQGDRI
jgi:hypothetical protein